MEYERCPADQKVTGSVPGQGACLGYGLGPTGPGLWVCESTLCFFPFCALHAPLSKNKYIKSLKKEMEYQNHQQDGIELSVNTFTLICGI